MRSYYKAVCINEIFWHNKVYRNGDPIVLDKADLDKLLEARVVANAIMMIQPESKTEYATKEAPETTMKEHGLRRKR